MPASAPQWAGLFAVANSMRTSGATAVFTPGSVTGSGSSTLVITAAAGTFNLTITGTSGSLTHSVSATLTVANPDFSISASPTSRSIKRGRTTTYTVSIGSIAGFTGTVGLSVSGTPSNETATFSPASLVGSGSATLTVATKSSSPSGTFYLTVTGSSGTLLHTAGASPTLR